MFEQSGTNSLADPTLIGRKLSQQQAGDGRLTGSDSPRQAWWHDRRWRKAIIADHPIRLVNDDNRCEALFLIGERPRLEPPVERRLAARELIENMGGR